MFWILREVRWFHLVAVTASWGAMWLGRWLLSLAFDLAIDFGPLWFLLRVLAAGMAGALSVLVVRQVREAIGWKGIAAVSLGWALSLAVAGSVAGYLLTVSGWDLQVEVLGASVDLAWDFAAILAGIVGMWITLGIILGRWTPVKASET
jgi:hypothetical protein